MSKRGGLKARSRRVKAVEKAMELSCHLVPRGINRIRIHDRELAPAVHKEWHGTNTAPTHCKLHMEQRKAKDGTTFWGCVRFPYCKGTQPIV